MELRLLKTFETVAALMSFKRAGEVLHCTQSTVSAQIKALEDDLRTPLFLRLGRRIVLTAAGEALLTHSRRLLDYEKEIYATLREKQEVGGLLSLRVPQSVADFHLPVILARFHARHPKVGFDISNCGYFRLADEMRAGQIDAAFLLADGLHIPELAQIELGREALAYVVHPASPLAARRGLGVGDLAAGTLLLPKHDCGYRMELERALAESGVVDTTLIELNSLSALVTCLKAGMGVALLPRRVIAAELAAGSLVALDWSLPLSTGLHLLWHIDKPRRGAFGAFLGIVEEYFRALPAVPVPEPPPPKKAARRGAGPGAKRL